MKYVYFLAEHKDITMTPETWRNRILESADGIFKGLQGSGNGCEAAIFWPEHAIIEGINALKNHGDFMSSGCPYDISVEKNAPLLASWGCKSTLIGHAEQRAQISAIMKEAGVQDLSGMNRFLNRQIDLSHKNAMTAVYTVGESSQQRLRGRWQELLKAQIEIGMYQVNPAQTLLAYQPGWEITPNTLPQLEETIAYLKRVSDGMDVIVALNAADRDGVTSCRRADGWLFTLSI